MGGTFFTAKFNCKTYLIFFKIPHRWRSINQTHKCFYQNAGPMGLASNYPDNFLQTLNQIFKSFKPPAFYK